MLLWLWIGCVAPTESGWTCADGAWTWRDVAVTDACLRDEGAQFVADSEITCGVGGFSWEIGVHRFDCVVEGDAFACADGEHALGGAFVGPERAVGTWTWRPGTCEVVYAFEATGYAP